MLIPRPPRVVQAGMQNSKTLRFFWPIPLTHSDLPMVPVAIGGVLGLHLLLRGCILLQRKSGSCAGKTSVVTATITTNAILSANDKEPQLPGRREIIQLSRDLAQADTNSMTQQGKIAAALLKAGVSSPASWTAAEDQPLATVDLADEQAVHRTTPGSLVQSLDFNASKILQKNASSTTLLTFSENNSVQPFHWKPAVMVWGGPILTLVCLYILALHFGWL